MRNFRINALIGALCLTVSTYAQQTQDVVYLKNGSVIHGQVTEFQIGGNVKVTNQAGDVIIYPADQVEKISKENSTSSYTRTSSSSPYLVRGYRGFVDGGLYVGGIKDANSTYARVGITTTHGCQFNPHIFFGGGFGWQFYPGDSYIDDLDLLVPIYAAFRYDILEGKISPFASARVGGYVGLSCEDENRLGGAYLNINAGVRIRRLNLSVGYEAMPGTFSEQDSYYGTQDIDLRINSFVFRVGVDVGRRN